MKINGIRNLSLEAGMDTEVHFITKDK
jgi:hypothetical protein